MTKEVADFLLEVADTCDSLIDFDVTLHEGYSGRGMFGATTYGILCDYPIELLGVAIQYAYEIDCDYQELELTGLHNLKVDQLGRSCILY